MTLQPKQRHAERATLGRGCSAVAALLLVVGLLLPSALATADNTETVSADGGKIFVELSEGKLIRLERAASSVFIANPGIADITVKSPRLIYLFGTHPGETSLFALDENDKIITTHTLVVTHNISRLNEALTTLVPGHQISATSIDGGIVLSGTVRNATQAEDARRLAARFLGEKEVVINQLQVTAPNTINLRVRVAEVSRTVLNQFGINWEAAYTGATDILFGIATGAPVLAGSLAGTGTVSPVGLANGTFLTRPGLQGNNAYFRSTAGDFDINGLIDLLAADGLVTVLAEPNLTALSGETATFLAGGEFPIPVPQTNGNITITFKQFGVSLAFTPTLLNDTRISMRVAPEVSQLTNTGAVTVASIQVPALTTRRAETTVELGSGQSFAIAGLLLDNTRQDHEEVPGLSDIPILGALFQSDRFERNETELVIIVTPYVVQPVASPNLLALPTDPYFRVEQSPTDRDLALSPGQPQTVPLNAGPAAGGVPLSASGFILE